MANTEFLTSRRTESLAVGNFYKSLSPLLTSQVTFEKNGKVYEISTELIDKGGESQLYLANEKNTGKQCVAKIHTSELVFHPSYQDNRNRVLYFLQKHSDYRKYHIMPVLDYGTIEIECDGKNLNYTIDILPFCQDRALKRSGRKIGYDVLRSWVIPALLKAISTSHSAGFIHRDIKPNNVFELDGEIVLGDFGTAVPFESGSENVHHTRYARGTLGYSAPEISHRYARPESDYFSLGCTLATLYNGGHPYKEAIDEGVEYVFYNSISEKGLAIDYRKGDEALMHLIDALTRIKPTERVGYEGVSLWLADDKAFYEKYVAEHTNGKQ